MRSKRINDPFKDHMKIPLFFKLWFGFVATLVLCIFGVVGFMFYTVITDPASVGRFTGEIVSGFNEKVQ